MPQICFHSISDFSSQHSSKQLLANNLLRTKDFKSWKCEEWQQISYVVLETKDAQRVDNIEIGNDCSAFVEVLVAKSDDPKLRFQVLLSTSSFMTPSESHSLNNCNRIRVFPKDKLSPNSQKDSWNRFKIVCTQPFNKSIPYGLAFVRFNTAAENEDQMEASVSSTALNIGPFRLRSENGDQGSDTNTGSLFTKRTNRSDDEPSKASSSLSLSSAIGLTPTSPKAPKPQQNSSNNSVKPKASTSVKTPHNTPTNTSSAGPSPPKRQRKPKTNKPFNELMSKVVFALSGFVNPKRSELRDKAIQMGAKYKSDWDQSCTHLICAFANTPKFNEVKARKGRIVREKWIEDCFNQKQSIYWRNYILGQYNGPDSDDSDDDNDSAPVPAPVVKTNRKRIAYIDDEEEDENESQMKEVIGFGDNTSDRESQSNDEIYDMETDNESTSADNTTNAGVENKCDKTIETQTIDIFKKKCFHFYGPFEEKEKQMLTQYIITNNGQLKDELTPEVKYVVTNADWNDDFEQACSTNELLIFVKPKWIHKCHEKSKLIPFQPFVVSCNYD